MKQYLTEFATLRKKHTKLPVNIWVDDAGTYLNSGHFKRIKFQKNYNNSAITNEFAIMLLDGTILEDTLKGCEISNKDLKKIQNFVKNNSLILSELADARIDLFDFKELMITGGEEASKSDIEVQHKLLQKYLS